MEELQGFVVQAELGRTKLEVSLIASSQEAAIRRTKASLVSGRDDVRWIDATYTVLEVIGIEEFKAGRAAGTR